MAVPGQHRTGFFDLATETRNAIYYLVFPQTTFICPTSQIDQFGIGYTYPARSLRISRRFAQEASIIFWTSCTFRFSSLDTAVQFIHLIGPNNSSMIHQIQIGRATVNTNLTLGDRTVEATSPKRNKIDKQLAVVADFIVRPCTSLRRLIIDDLFLRARKDECRLQMFRDLQQWQTAVAMRGLTRIEIAGFHGICVMADGESGPTPDDAMNIYNPVFEPLDISEKIEGLVDIIEIKKAAAKAHATAARQARQLAEQQQQAADDAAARAQEQARVRAQARAVAQAEARAEARGRARQDALWRDHLAAQQAQDQSVSENSYDYDDPDMMLRLFDEFS